MTIKPALLNALYKHLKHIWGIFDFNKTPMAPPGCRVVVHESPEARATYASHGVEGFYCEPAMNHYRNYNCYIPETRAMQKGITVDFFPKNVQMPKTSSRDRLAAAIENMVEVLKNPHPAQPTLEEGTPTNDALTKLQQIFQP